jgi:glyoxylase-like metal-dependent hydrolase (beta-lactamase superfamily II)
MVPFKREKNQLSRRHLQPESAWNCDKKQSSVLFRGFPWSFLFFCRPILKLSDHCHAVLGFATVPPWTVNAGIVFGSSLTLVVDAGPSHSAARTLYGYASAVKPGNRMAAVNTEPHLDHIGGNAFFREKGMDIYGHPGPRRTDQDLQAEIQAYNACIPDRARRERREGEIAFEKTVIVNSNVPVRKDHVLDLGTITATILMTPGHTPYNLSVFVPDEGILYCGDCIVSRYAPNLECGSVGDWIAWLASLDAIDSLKPEMIVPGHGPELTGAAMDSETGRIRAVLRKAIRTGHPDAGSRAVKP